MQDKGKCIFEGEQGLSWLAEVDVVVPGPAGHALSLSLSRSRIGRGQGEGRASEER